MKKFINIVENILLTASIISAAIFCVAWCLLIPYIALYALAGMLVFILLAVFCEICKQ